MSRFRNRIIAGVLASLFAMFSLSANAGNFFTDLFGRSTSNGESFGTISLGYAPSQDQSTPFPPKAPKRIRAPESAFCVRTCDGRYFPAPASVNSSRADSCKSFCPASDTKVYYGSSIDDAAGGDGKPYSKLTNAYRYRNELVTGCTCNGKSNAGLASVKIEDDSTLRKGDLVASDAGLHVATRSFDRKGEPVRLSQTVRSIRVMASQ